MLYLGEVSTSDPTVLKMQEAQQKIFDYLNGQAVATHGQQAMRHALESIDKGQLIFSSDLWILID